MEHQTINAYGNGYKKAETGYDSLLQHEFAHEWFGNQLTNVDWDDMWLHEGFGSYMQPLYLQWLRGDMEHMAELMQRRAKITNKFPIVSGRSMEEGEVYDAKRGPGGDIYVKAALMLHTLRGLIGDDAFFRATRELVYGTATPRPGNFKPRYASTDDFIAIVNRTSGKDLRWFFDTYLRYAALPELLATRDADGLSLRWKTTGDRPFPMPVQVRVGDALVDVPMTGGRGRLELPPGASYTLDPHSRRAARIAAHRGVPERHRGACQGGGGERQGAGRKEALGLSGATAARPPRHVPRAGRWRSRR